MRFFVYTFVFCMAFATVLGSVGLEDAPVKDGVLKKLGFHCNSQRAEIGPMRKGEVKRLAEGLCQNVECLDGGRVTYVSCSPLYLSRGCEVVKGDVSRPYPECCDFFRC